MCVYSHLIVVRVVAYLPNALHLTVTQSSQSRAKERQGLQKDADPQQSWQPRPEERRPAVAGENMPDSLEPWRGRRGRRSDGQPMSSGTWPGGTWSDAGATNALGWGKYKAAVAASEPMKVASNMGTSRVWSDQEPQCPASALRDVVRRGGATLADSGPYETLASG